MPDLPSLTLSQAHFDRVVAAFPGADLTAKAAAYKAWLTGQLIDFVGATEAQRLEAKFAAEKEAALASLSASLPPRPQFPPTA